jgi:DNA mismatch repair protein MutL
MTPPAAAVNVWPEEKAEPAPRPAAAAPFWEKKRPALGPLKVLAQLGNAYILCQAEDGLVIVDQHAAHERIVYETLKKGFAEAKAISQHLLMPEIIELSPMDFSLLEKATDRLKRLGLMMEPFGGNSMVVKAVPALISRNEVQKLMAELVDGLNELPHSSHEELVIDKALTIMACHGSVRARQSLSREEMVRLVEDLTALNAPLHCPHGRPVFVRLGYDQIEKELKRR